MHVSIATLKCAEFLGKDNSGYSLRSKRFSLVSEQKEILEGDFRF